MPQLALLLEYRGTGYHGFQLQARHPTIQGEMEKAWERLTGEGSRVRAASRTDAGVHALGQVATLMTASHLPLSAFVAGLNHYLPRDIVVRAARWVAEGFHVRHQAQSREYRYTIVNRPTPSPLLADRAYWVRQPLDGEAMARSAQSLLGQHDFRSFAPPLGRRSPMRTMMRAQVEKRGQTWEFTLEADSFLPHQVRRIVGALVEVGRGRLGAEEFARLVTEPRTGAAGPATPAWGLCLWKVNYGEDLFPEQNL